jgi:hypothetical protein
VGHARGKQDLRGSGSYLPSTIRFLARVVKWQTRTFEGRMPQGMGVQVPPRANRRSAVSFRSRSHQPGGRTSLPGAQFSLKNLTDAPSMLAYVA